MMEKTRNACTEWLQRCKEASYYMGYNFRLALLQRSSQDMAKVIRSLDKELSHDKLIEEIMCAFSGIPSTAAAIDWLSHICQQPGPKPPSSTSTNTETSTVVHQEVAMWRNIQAHTQPVLLFTARPIGRKLWGEIVWCFLSIDWVICRFCFEFAPHHFNITHILFSQSWLTWFHFVTHCLVGDKITDK